MMKATVISVQERANKLAIIPIVISIATFIGSIVLIALTY